MIAVDQSVLTNGNDGFDAYWTQKIRNAAYAPVSCPGEGAGRGATPPGRGGLG